jgi:hypothetical protein
MADSTTDASASETASATTTQDSNVVELQKELEKAKAERKKANEEAAAYRLKEKERLEKEQLEQGKFAELTAAAQKERDELAAKLAALETVANEKSAKLEAIEKARKTELLSKLPAEKRAAYENFDLTVLEQITKDFSTASPTGNSQGNERGTAGANNGAFQVLSPEAALELKRTNPAAYHKYLEEFLK